MFQSTSFIFSWPATVGYYPACQKRVMNRNTPRPYQQMIKASRNAGFLSLILCTPWLVLAPERPAKAVQAARRIKFIPAAKDGKQVSMWIELQYNFNLY
jgi:hypothetical protein